MATIKYKDPDEVIDYTHDWSKRLEDGDTIASSAWAVDAGLTEDSDSFTNSTTTVWLSGGTLTESYTAVNSITTTLGREMDKTFIFIMREN